jgi:hypothetical protein
LELRSWFGGIKYIEDSDVVEAVVLVVPTIPSFFGVFIPSFSSVPGLRRCLLAFEALDKAYRGLLKCREYEAGSSSCLMGLIFDWLDSTRICLVVGCHPKRWSLMIV